LEALDLLKDGVEVALLDARLARGCDREDAVDSYTADQGVIWLGHDRGHGVRVDAGRVHAGADAAGHPSRELLVEGVELLGVDHRGALKSPKIIDGSLVPSGLIDMQLVKSTEYQPLQDFGVLEAVGAALPL
jgi:hypothetical protein